MGGRHRSRPAHLRRTLLVGSTGVFVLLCGAMVYAVGALGDESGLPDPPRRSASASTSGAGSSKATSGIAPPVATQPGAGMHRPPSATDSGSSQPSRTAGASAPASTRRPRSGSGHTAARPPQRKPTAVPSSPQVSRSGNCYVIHKDGHTYTYCPNRGGNGRPPHRR